MRTYKIFEGEMIFGFCCVRVYTIHINNIKQTFSGGFPCFFSILLDMFSYMEKINWY